MRVWVCQCQVVLVMHGSYNYRGPSYSSSPPFPRMHELVLLSSLPLAHSRIDRSGNLALSACKRLSMVPVSQGAARKKRYSPRTVRLRLNTARALVTPKKRHLSNTVGGRMTLAKNRNSVLSAAPQQENQLFI